MIEGGILYGNTDIPIEARLWIYFGWMLDGEHLEEIVNTRPGSTGYYIDEGLPVSEAEIHVLPSNIGGRIERIETVKLGERMRVQKDILVTSISVLSEISNIPLGTRELFVIAHSGEVEVRLGSIPNFMKMRDTMVGLSHNPHSELKGLKPGRYCITATCMARHV